MQVNLHTPERGRNESQHSYRTRQQMSRERAKQLTVGPTQPRFVPTADQPLPANAGYWWKGQHTNTQNNEWRKQKRLLGARLARKMLKEARRGLDS